VAEPVSDAALTFPCDLAIKVLGRNTEEFRDAALAIVRAHSAGVSEQAVVERVSREGAYLSLTITARMDSRAQADAVYRELSANDQILIVL
jgi:putative lipoic acid-binding regulatory protein